jgi:hypothetical protein
VVWAAKEAAYKLISKELHREHFVPREFVTTFDGGLEWESSLEFNVFYADTQMSVAVAVSEECVHAIATIPGGVVLGWRVREIADCSLEGLAAPTESEAVRILAAQVLSDLGREEVLDFAGRIPVLRRVDSGVRKGCISLSHHGAYAAVAVGRAKSDTEGAVERLTRVVSSGESCSTCMA